MQIGIVQPRYGALRRTLLPIYAIDQLVTFALIALPFIALAAVNPRLALYTGVGAYIGVVITMQRSTPSKLLLRGNQEGLISAMLDRSPFFRRADGLEWISTKGRLHRWDTDNIRIRRLGDNILVTGREIDLRRMAYTAAQSSSSS